jgi:hypothetical protein
MKTPLFLSLIVIVLLYGCGSTKSSVLNRDPSFNPNDFFNTSITVYYPLSVSISNTKYADYKEENTKSEIANMLKERIEKVSPQANVFIGKEIVPSYFRGVLISKEAGMEFIKSARTKYLVFIQEVLVGEDSKMQSMQTSTGVPYSYSQRETKTTMYFDIWDKDVRASVFSIEVKAAINDGLLVNSLNSSFSNAVDEFISNIKK